MKIIFSFALLVSTFALSAQKNVVVDTIWVGGVCGMCEERIERAMDTKGIITADFDLHTNQLALVYKSKKISIDEIHTLLNNVGHDTERSKAPDEVYNEIHACCRYRAEDSKHECDDPDNH